MKNLRQIYFTALSTLALAPALLFAQGQGVGGSGGLKNPLDGPNSDNLFALIDAIVNAVLQLGAVIAVLAIIYAGFLFVTAGGDEKKITTAKSVLLYTVIGIAILLGARVIANVVKTTVTNVGKAAS